MKTLKKIWTLKPSKTIHLFEIITVTISVIGIAIFLVYAINLIISYTNGHLLSNRVILKNESNYEIIRDLYQVRLITLSGTIFLYALAFLLVTIEHKRLSVFLPNLDNTKNKKQLRRLKKPSRETIIIFVLFFFFLPIVWLEIGMEYNYGSVYWLSTTCFQSADSGLSNSKIFAYSIDFASKYLRINMILLVLIEIASIFRIIAIRTLTKCHNN